VSHGHPNEPQPSGEAAARRWQDQARGEFERTQLRDDPNEPSRRRASPDEVNGTALAASESKRTRQTGGDSHDRSQSATDVRA